MPLHGLEPRCSGSRAKRRVHGLALMLCAAACLLATPPSWAHHTSAMFEPQKSIELTGTVKMFQWTNPHCWIQLLVQAGDKTTEWSIEMGPPMDLLRNGWKRGTLKAGDKITVVIRPTRDGSPAGLFVSAQWADGKPIT